MVLMHDIEAKIHPTRSRVHSNCLMHSLPLIIPLTIHHGHLPSLATFVDVCYRLWISIFNK